MGKLTREMCTETNPAAAILRNSPLPTAGPQLSRKTSDTASKRWNDPIQVRIDTYRQLQRRKPIIEGDLIGIRSNLIGATGKWKPLLDHFEHYYLRNNTNSSSVVLAAQMLLICARSYLNRKAIGGFAGEFIYQGFYYAAYEMKTGMRNVNWDGRVVNQKHQRPYMEDLDRHFGDVSGAVWKGYQHFVHHLIPGFNVYISSNFDDVLNHTPLSQSQRRDQLSKVKAMVSQIVNEHERFLAGAVVPSFKDVNSMAAPMRAMAGNSVALVVTYCRNYVLATELIIRYKMQEITEEDMYDIASFRPQIRRIILSILEGSKTGLSGGVRPWD